ncbi:MAG: hypothetical protein FJ095_08870, partial [Deltaproteobacteria bacterium]|nr:hypothetical protein [Deltaproteobacteria bacterium]
MRTSIRRGTQAAALIAAFSLASGASAPVAFAQQDKVTEVARAKFMEGVAAFDAKRYVEARDLFMQAYAMKRHPAVLLNLGLCEVRLGEADQGANHLQQFLREFEQATPQQKQNARDGINEAKKTAAYVIAIVDTDGATVLVDGEAIGPSPLADPIFVKPGDHDVEARAEGKVIRTKVQAKVGLMASAQLNLRSGAAESLPAGTKKTPRPASGGDAASGDEAKPDESNRWSNDLPPTESGPYAGGVDPNVKGGPPSGVREVETRQVTNRKDFLPWMAENTGAMVLAGVGGAGFLTSLIAGIAAGVAKGDVNSVTEQILAEARSGNPGSSVPVNYRLNGNPIPCGRLDTPESSLPHYRNACD